MRIEIGPSGIPQVVDSHQNGVLVVDIYLQPLAKLADASIGSHGEPWALAAARPLLPGSHGGPAYGVRLVCEDADRLRTRSVGQE